MLRRLCLPLLLASLFATPLPASADEGGDPASVAGPETTDPAAADPGDAEAAWLGRITGDKVHVRSGPSLNDMALEQLPRGSWVIVTGTVAAPGGEDPAAGDADSAPVPWLRVRIPGGVPVFVHASLVDVADTVPDDPAAATRRTGIINATDVVLRPTAGKEFPPVRDAKLHEGTEVRVLETGAGADGQWVRVLPPDDFQAFVHGSLVERIGDPEGREEELRRITLERRDSYTGGDEAARATAAERQREEALEALVVAAVGALETTPATAMPPETATHLEALDRVMTESGDPDLRLRANLVARDFAERSRRIELARVRAERDQVKEDLEARLAEVEQRYREEVERLRAAEASEAASVGRDWMAVGTVRRTRNGFELVKAGVVLHRIESLRYDLSELVDLRIGVDGRRITVDADQGIVLLRVDTLEILE